MSRLLPASWYAILLVFASLLYIANSDTEMSRIFNIFSSQYATTTDFIRHQAGMNDVADRANTDETIEACRNLYAVFNILTEADKLEELNNCGISFQKETQVRRKRMFTDQQANHEEVIKMAPWTAKIIVEYTLRFRTRDGEADIKLTGRAISTGMIIQKRYVLASRYALPLGIYERLRFKYAGQIGKNADSIDLAEQEWSVTVTAGSPEVQRKVSDVTLNTASFNPDIEYYELASFANRGHINLANGYLGLAIVRVAEPFQYSDTLRSVCLPGMSSKEEFNSCIFRLSPPGVRATAAGYGSRTEYCGAGELNWQSFDMIDESYNGKVVVFEDDRGRGEEGQSLRGAAEADLGAGLTTHGLMQTADGAESRAFAFSMITYAKHEPVTPARLSDPGVIGANVHVLSYWVAYTMMDMESRRQHQQN